MHRALHKLVWKFIWINVNSETLGNGKPKPNTIIECALKRLEKKIIAHTENLELKKKKLDGLSETLVVGKGEQRKLQPWIQINKEGEITEYSEEYKKLAKDYGLHIRKRPQPVPTDAPGPYTK